MIPYLPAHFNIVVDANLTEEGEPIEVDRTWKERFFSLPWRPLKKTKTVIPRVPSKAVYGLPTGQWIMHPETFEAFKREVDWGNNK